MDGVNVILEFFCPVEAEGEPGGLKRNPGGEAGSKISAIQLRGAEIAAADCVTVMLSGEVLDHGGHRDVEVQVANILPFLVLKAFALVTRDKEKDAYDIVWTLQAFGEAGPVSAARPRCRVPSSTARRSPRRWPSSRSASPSSTGRVRATTPGSSSAAVTTRRRSARGSGAMRAERSRRFWPGGRSYARRHRPDRRGARRGRESRLDLLGLALRHDGQVWATDLLASGDPSPVPARRDRDLNAAARLGQSGT